MRLFLLVLLGFLSLGQTVLADDSFKVWAFNLRYASNSKPNAWPDRLPVMANLINEKNPDIIGTQEGKFYQLKELNKKNAVLKQNLEPFVERILQYLDEKNSKIEIESLY